MKGLLIFAFGVAVGATFTWQYAKQRFEEKPEPVDISEESEVKEEKPEPPKDTEPSVAEYAKVLSKQGYTDYTTSAKEEKKEVDDTNRKESVPHVIPPEEFGMMDDYDTMSLTLYSDRVLVDENDEKLEDVDGAVGIDSLDHFGEYEDEAVYVRNDRLKVDYEILLDQRTYSEILEEKPYLKELNEEDL